MPNAHNNDTLFGHRKEVRSLKLKINFFNPGGRFRRQVKRLRKTLARLGALWVFKEDGNIGQYRLKTPLSPDEILRKAESLRLRGKTTVHEEENDKKETV